MPKFRLLRGKHVERHPEGGVDELGQPRVIRYVPGDVFESAQDLDKKYNQPPHSIKFERIQDGAPVVTQNASPDLLERMTVEKLRRYAEIEEIDLGKARSKEEIIKTIREALVTV